MNQSPGYWLFDTALGPCGIAWSEAGITHVQLPSAHRGISEARLRKASGAPSASEPPFAVRSLMALLQRYFGGEPVAFTAVTLDIAGVPPFHRRVYDEARRIGWGETVSYGELARRAGEPGAARAVGQAMGRNPAPVVIPCHRVLAQGDRLGGFSAFGGNLTKERLLVLERVRLPLLA